MFSEGSYLTRFFNRIFWRAMEHPEPQPEPVEPEPVEGEPTRRERLIKELEEAIAFFHSQPEYRLIRNKVTCKVRIEERIHKQRFIPKSFDHIPTDHLHIAAQDVREQAQHYKVIDEPMLPGVPLEFATTGQALDYLDKIEAERIIGESWTEVIDLDRQGAIPSQLPTGPWKMSMKNPANKGQLVTREPVKPCSGKEAA